MRDIWEEIFSTIRSNKLRTFLTGFSIAWGIFMLIVLLASGNGLQNAMTSNFRYMSTNSFSLYPGVTSKPYKGMQSGRELKFKHADIEFLRTNLKNIKDFTPIYNKWSSNLVRGDQNYTSTLSGVEPDYINLRKLDMKEGRFFNKLDSKERRKVVVMHQSTVKILFPEGNAIGQYVDIDGIPFQLCGIYDEVNSFREPSFYIPFSTSEMIYNPTGEVGDISFTVEGIASAQESEAYVQSIRDMLSEQLLFDPNDENAVWISDRTSSFLEMQQIFRAIALFVWIIGIGTLIAGVVGVSNIMLITVKERTREFGIRKALGATPNSILGLVVLESITITAIFGYIGMVLGIGLTELVAKLLSSQPVNPQEPVMFMNPTVDLSVVFMATLILIVAGVLAGYMPARKAVKIKPIEAMQTK